MPESPKAFLQQHAPRHKQERWCFTAHEIRHPEDCFSNDPFVAHISEDEFRQLDPWETLFRGVIVQRNGVVTDIWEDGDTGVPESAQQAANWAEELSKPVYYGDNHAVNTNDEVTLAWRDVLCDGGRFVRFTDGQPKAAEIIDHELPD